MSIRGARGFGDGFMNDPLPVPIPFADFSRGMLKTVIRGARELTVSRLRSPRTSRQDMHVAFLRLGQGHLHDLFGDRDLDVHLQSRNSGFPFRPP